MRAWISRMNSWKWTRRLRRWRLTLKKASIMSDLPRPTPPQMYMPRGGLRPAPRFVTRRLMLPGAVLAVVLELAEEALEPRQHAQLLAVGLEVRALLEVPVPLERARVLVGVRRLELFVLERGDVSSVAHGTQELGHG